MTQETSAQAAARRRAAGRALRRVRTEAGLRQSDVASGLGVPQSFVSKYETGERRLDVADLLAVCTVLGIDPRRFIDILEDEIGQGKQNAPG